MSEYAKISLDAPAEREEDITMLMMEHGAGGVEIYDPALIKQHLEAGDWDASVFDGQDIVVGTVTLSCLIEGGEEAAKPLLDAIAAYAQATGLGLSPRLEAVAEQDWQNGWKRSFQPLLIGEKLFVKPYWDESPVPEGRIPLLIDPGMAFGTGDHATTAMMLEMIEEYQQPGQRIMDFGCGSGILAIAGLLLGASEAVAVDMDPVCAEATKRHLELNHIDPERFTFICGDIIGEEKLQRQLRRDKAQLVVANINFAAVYDLARIVFRFMAPNAMFLCSGILADQGGILANRLVNTGLAIIKSREQGEWCAFGCVISYE